MTVTQNDVTPRKIKAEPSAEAKVAADLVRLAKEQGLSLTGPDGLLKQLTKTVLETALNEEITEHLGYEKHEPSGAGSGNVRNGSRSKTVLTGTTGPVQIDVPRDRAGTFVPQIVKKRQRRLSGVNEVVLSLYAKGLTTGKIACGAPNSVIQCELGIRSRHSLCSGQKLNMFNARPTFFEHVRVDRVC